MLYAEDLVVGRTFALGAWTLSADDIKAFARTWDPLPMHVDEDAAAAGPFDGLIASGLHTIAIAIRLTVDALVSQIAVHAGREMRSLRLHKAVRPGTTLSGSVQITEQRLRDDGRGVIVWRVELRDGDGDAVLSVVTETLVFRRA
jgi:acyl dehydratase